MRLTCPSCGVRDSREFSYKGDASRTRPHDDALMFDYVYLRDNPKGPHQDYWLHQPCRTWLVVSRNTVTHEIFSVTPAAHSGADQ
jgi:heterotetrameric sarcosine oxidase delta subunit